MGLFDRFRKRVEEVVEATNADSISADEASHEGREALMKAEEYASQSKESNHQQSAYDESTSDDDWKMAGKMKN